MFRQVSKGKLKKQTSEQPYESQVREYSDSKIETVLLFFSEEDFIVGLNVAKNSLHMHCNIQNMFNVTFRYCRFVRSDNKVALRLKEGLSDGKYSYYGSGLNHGDCGLTIDNPITADFTVWRCHIGITRYVNKTYSEHFTKDSMIYVPRDRAVRDEENKERVILGGAGTSLTLLCESNYRLKYCWFKHPNGTVINTQRYEQHDI